MRWGLWRDEHCKYFFNTYKHFWLILESFKKEGRIFFFHFLNKEEKNWSTEEQLSAWTDKAKQKNLSFQEVNISKTKVKISDTDVCVNFFG